jgi:hydroxymethylbilane synthase
MKSIVIGTRGSDLALWQANHVRDALLIAHDDLEVKLEIIHTKGDLILQTPLHKMLDKGLFTKEIESALLAGTIDLAVHSLKDLPTQLPQGLAMAAIGKREDPADVLVGKTGDTLEDLPKGAPVLTGSLRRAAQMLDARGDLDIRPVRGNVATRLRKLDESDAAAIILASAGLVRLGLADRITHRLDPERFLPACGQGALGIEIRDGDKEVADMLTPLDDMPTRVAVTAERTFLGTLGGGCQAPIGAFGRISDSGTLVLTGMVATLDGTQLIKQTIQSEQATPESAEALGRDLAKNVCLSGAREILDEIAANAPTQPEEH